MKLIVTTVFVIIYLVVITVDCFQIDDEYHYHKLTPIHRIRKQDNGPIEDPIAPPIIQKNYTTPTLEGNSHENVKLSRDTVEAGNKAPIPFRNLRDAPSEEASGQETKPSNQGKSFRRIRDLHKDASAQSDEVPAKEEPRIFRRYFRDVKNLRGSRQAPQNEQSNPNVQSQEQSETLSGESQSQEISPQAQAVRTIRQTAVDQANQEPSPEGSQNQEQPRAVRKYRQAEQPKQESDSEAQSKALRRSRQLPHLQPQKDENQSQEQPKALRRSRQLPDPQPQKDENQSQEQPKALRKSRQLPDPQPQKDENQSQEQPKALRKSRQLPDPPAQNKENQPQEQPKPLRKSRQIPTEQNNPQPQKEETQTGEQAKSFRRSRQTPPAVEENPSKDASQAQEQPKTLRKARQTAPQETQSGEAKPEASADQPQALRRSRQAPNATEQASPEAPKQEQLSSLRRVRQETKDESQPEDQPQPGLQRVRQTDVVEGEMKPSREEQKTIRKRRDEVGAPTKDVPSVPAPQEQAQAIRKARRDEEVGLMDSEESLYDESKEFDRDLRDAFESQEDNKNKDETLGSKESQQSSLLRFIRNVFHARIPPKRDTVGVSFMEDFTNNNDHYYKLIESRFARSNDEASLQQAPSSASQERQRFFRYAMEGTPVENAEKKNADETIDLVRMLRHANDETQEVPRDLQRRSVIIEDDEHGDGHGSSSFF